MNESTQALMFSKKSDEWITPQDLFEALDKEFGFVLDAAANPQNTKCKRWLGPGSKIAEDALGVPWGDVKGAIFLNPPYSRVKEFVEKASTEGRYGNPVVCLLPARTDTRWFHEYIWDRTIHAPYEWIEVRFLKGRLKFGGGVNSAPFPSMVVVFR